MHREQSRQGSETGKALVCSNSERGEETRSHRSLNYVSVLTNSEEFLFTLSEVRMHSGTLSRQVTGSDRGQKAHCRYNVESNLEGTQTAADRPARRVLQSSRREVTWPCVVEISKIIKFWV